MTTPSPVPVPMGANPEQPYTYVAWPQWFFREDGRRQIFNSAEEVPEGWYSLDELNELFPGALDNTSAPRAHEQASRDDGQEVIRQESVAGDEVGHGDATVLKDELEGGAPAGGTEVREKAEEKPRQLTKDQRDALILKLVDGNTQADLLTQLELMDEARVADGQEELEYAANWPKKKLAETIADNGGPLETE